VSSIVSLIFLFIILVFMRFSYKRINIPLFMLSVISVFSIGYYVLPPLLNAENLNGYSDSEVAIVLLMALVFFLSFAAGLIQSDSWFSNKPGRCFVTPTLDEVYRLHSRKFFVIFWILWIFYHFNTASSSYSAEDFEAFFHERSVFAGALGAFSSIFLAGMVVSLLIESNRFYQQMMLLFFLLIPLFLMISGQRLAVLTPLFILIFGYVMKGNVQKSYKYLVLGIVFLLLISPLMVATRQVEGFTGTDKFFSAIESFNYGSDVLVTIVESILDRSDLLSVSILLKDYIDNSSFASFEYYKSVLLAFIPKVIYADKPYPLSDTGDIWGELSVIAWVLVKGQSTGSLTAFGFITAYREAGWFWMLINGFLTGVLFSFVWHKFGKISLIGKILFLSIVTSLTIKQVPPSFFYALLTLVPVVYFSIVLIFLDNLVSFLWLRVKK